MDDGWWMMAFSNIWDLSSLTSAWCFLGRLVVVVWTSRPCNGLFWRYGMILLSRYLNIGGFVSAATMVTPGWYLNMRPCSNVLRYSILICISRCDWLVNGYIGCHLACQRLQRVQSRTNLLIHYSLNSSHSHQETCEDKVQKSGWQNRTRSFVRFPAIHRTISPVHQVSE